MPKSPAPVYDYIIVGAGSAGCGIAEQIIAAMKAEGLI